MSAIEPVLTSLLTRLAEVAVTQVSSHLKALTQKREPFASAMRLHLDQVSRWSQRIQVYGVSEGQDTSSVTVPLQSTTQPRRFRSRLTDASLRSEADILASPESLMILGDPGSGKTTTLKRLALTLLHTRQREHRLPVVILLRSMQPESAATPNPLLRFIAETLGIEHHVVVEKDADGKEIQKINVGPSSIASAVPLLLEKMRAILMLDGLDELPESLLHAVYDDIELLARSSVQARLLVTCRSGAYGSNLEGLDILELCPLSQDQQEAIAEHWIEDPAAFWQAIGHSSFADVGDRPLMLVQLLMLYRRDGYLPAQPSVVCRRLVHLLLEDWDSQRRVRRGSRYAAFLSERKAVFLSALAYYLTYKIKSKVFSVSQLLSAYEHIYMKFDLPIEEGRKVVAELETHTGIIVVLGDDFEFSHLSLQEYLCADYLVREPFPERLRDYIVEYPEPLAVATALSSDPGAWLAGLTLKEKNLSCFSEESIRRFLSRLAIERPAFGVSRLAGLAMVVLFARDLHVFRHGVLPELQVLLGLPGVAESIGLVLRDFEVREGSRTNGEVLELFLRDRATGIEQWELPTRGALPRRTLQDLGERYHCLEFKAPDGRVTVLKAHTDETGILWPRR